MSDIPAEMMARAAGIVANIESDFLPVDVAPDIQARFQELKSKVGFLKASKIALTEFVARALMDMQAETRKTDASLLRKVAEILTADMTKDKAVLAGELLEVLADAIEEGVGPIEEKPNTVAAPSSPLDSEGRQTAPSPQACRPAHHNDDNHVSAPMQEPLRP